LIPSINISEIRTIAVSEEESYIFSTGHAELYTDSKVPRVNPSVSVY